MMVKPVMMGLRMPLLLLMIGYPTTVGSRDETTTVLLHLVQVMKLEAPSDAVESGLEISRIVGLTLA